MVVQGLWPQTALLPLEFWTNLNELISFCFCYYFLVSNSRLIILLLDFTGTTYFF